MNVIALTQLAQSVAAELNFQRKMYLKHETQMVCIVDYKNFGHEPECLDSLDTPSYRLRS